MSKSSFNEQLQELYQHLEYISKECSTLLDLVLHQTFPISGNIAIFAQSNAEYEEFSETAKKITKPSANPNQKYFELIEPRKGFTHLYIRKYDPSEYGKYLGDVDFVANPVEYNTFKQRVIRGDFIGARMYNRPGWDTIQLALPGIDVVAYLCTQEMAEKARAKFDSLTNL